MGHSINWAKIADKKAILPSDDTSVLYVETDLNEVDKIVLQQPHHTVFIPLSSDYERHDVRIEGGATRLVTPVIGSAWVIPADHRYEVSVTASTAKCLEIRIPAKTQRGAEVRLNPAFNAHDGVLHAMGLLCIRLACEPDDISALIRAQTLDLTRSIVVQQYGDALPAKPHRELSDKNRVILVDYIEAHLGDRIQITDLASLAGITIHKLLVQFRHSFGTTPAQYIIQRRIELAQVLLRGSRAQVTEIALATGFYSSAHFSSAFKSHVGITPIDFRSRE